MLGFNRLRKKAEKRVLSNLSLPQLFYVPKGKTSGNVMRLELHGHFLRVFPLYRSVKICEVQWNKEIWQSVSLVRDALTRLAQTLRDRFVSLFSERAKTHIADARLDAGAQIKEAYEYLQERFIENCVRKSCDHFRRGLMEKLSVNCEQIFASHVSNHLGMLAYKMREEFEKQRQNNFSPIVQSGGYALPDNTRFIFGHKKTSVYVIEQNPQVRTVLFGKVPKSTDLNSYTLAFPFIVFFAAIRDNSIRGLRVFFRNAPIESVTDALFCPALSNVNENTFQVCLPYPNTRGGAKKIIAETLQNFWGSAFNSDWSAFLNSAKASFPQISTLSRWQEETKRNQNFITSISWHSAQKTVETAARGFLEEAEGEAVKDASQKTDLSSYEPYLKRLSGELAQKIQEACFFLVEHVAVDDISRSIAEKELEKTFSKTFEKIKERMEKHVEDIFEPITKSETIEVPVNKTIAEIESDARRAEENIRRMFELAFEGKNG